MQRYTLDEIQVAEESVKNIINFKKETIMNNTGSLTPINNTASDANGTAAYQYATSARGTINVLCKSDATDSQTNTKAAIEAFQHSATDNTNMSLFADQESTSISIVRNGSIEGHCKKSKAPNKHAGTVLSMCLHIPTITTMATAQYLDSLLNCTVYLFNDKKDTNGYFQNPAYRYRGTQQEEFLSVQDTRGHWEHDNATNLDPIEVASFETLMHFKVELEKASVDDESTYMLILDRQRTTFEWIVFTNHKEQIDASAYVYNGIALAELHVNDFMIELRDSTYEAQFDIGA